MRKYEDETQPRLWETAPHTRHDTQPFGAAAERQLAVETGCSALYIEVLGAAHGETIVFIATSSVSTECWN